MYGLIMSNFTGYLIQKYGEEAWDNIRRLSNIDNATFAVHQVWMSWWSLINSTLKKSQKWPNIKSFFTL